MMDRAQVKQVIPLIVLAVVSIVLMAKYFWPGPGLLVAGATLLVARSILQERPWNSNRVALGMAFVGVAYVLAFTAYQAFLVGLTVFGYVLYALIAFPPCSIPFIVVVALVGFHVVGYFRSRPDVAREQAKTASRRTNITP